VIELVAICVIFLIKFGAGLVAATLVMVAIYITFTRKVTDWRAQLQRQMNEVDNKAIGRAVDSLLNYETVKYFGAEEREAKRYDEAIGAFANATVRNEVSLAWLNIGQALITNLMMAGAMAYTVWGWSHGQFSTGDVVLVNTLLSQLFRPLDLLGMVYRTIRQGLIDMEAMYKLIDTQAEISDAPGAPMLHVEAGEVRFDHVHFGYDPEREILHGVSFTVPAGRTLAIVGPSGAELHEENDAGGGKLDQRWADVEQQEVEHHVDALGAALDDLAERARAPLEVEAQRQIVDVPEYLAGEPPRGVLPDLLEQSVAEVVRQHAGEARRRVSRDERRNHAERRGVARHAVDHRLVGEGHQQDRGLAGKDQHDRRDDADLQLGLALGPEHREEAPQRAEAAAGFRLLRCLADHRP
jgi:hypothetical protein